LAATTVKHGLNCGSMLSDPPEEHVRQVVLKFPQKVGHAVETLKRSLSMLTAIRGCRLMRPATALRPATAGRRAGRTCAAAALAQERGTRRWRRTGWRARGKRNEVGGNYKRRVAKTYYLLGEHRALADARGYALGVQQG